MKQVNAAESFWGLSAAPPLVLLFKTLVAYYPNDVLTSSL